MASWTANAVETCIGIYVQASVLMFMFLGVER